LNVNGTVDSSFFVGDGPDASVRAVQIQPDDGRIIVAGSFHKIGTTTRNYIGRLTQDGGIDLTFDPGAGPDNPVYTVLVQPDRRIVIGGDFSAYGSIARNG